MIPTISISKVREASLRLALVRLRSSSNERRFVRFDDQSRQEALSKHTDIESDRIPSLMPPIGVGHEDEDNVLGRSDLPKQGEVINLYIDGNVLKADFGRVPLQICKLVKRGIYDKVSCELWEKPPGKFAGEGWMLKRVALLGADVPGVYTLSEIPDPDEGMGVIKGVEIFEVGKHNDIEYTLDDLKRILRNYWLNRPSEDKRKELVRRYLKLDAVRPLGDGAATDQFKDAKPVVRIFRSMGKTYSVDTSTGRMPMTAEQIRQALVAEGIFEQDEVNAMSDQIIMKLAKLVGLETANADAEPAAKTEDEKKPDAANADAAPAAPAADPEKKPDAAMADGQQKMMTYADKILSYKIAKAVAPLLEKVEQLSGNLKSQQKYVDTARRDTIHQQATHFADKLRSEKRLTHGMHANAVELYQFLAEQPAEVHFSDGGKQKKGSALELFKKFMSAAPVLENWDETVGGPLGSNPADRKSADHEKLKAKYQSFSSSFKKQMSEKKYLDSYDAAVEMYGDDYTVEQFVQG